ncbi:MAG: response regulator [Desulfobacterales bacterium]|nr:response regulator [Desulfobacterales bacterium]
MYLNENELKANILLIDDDPINLRFLIEILKTSGYQIRAAVSGETALTSIEMKIPDLILLDINMPEMDGYEVCKMIKQNHMTKDVPVLFISASNEIFDKVNAFSAGGIDYMTKPVHPEEVLLRVKTHLSLKTMQERIEKQNLQLRQEITERKQIELQLHQYQNYLEELVKERTEQLSRSNEHLTQEIEERKKIEVELIQSAKLAALGELAAGVAHELNQPLNGIKIIAQSIIIDIHKKRLVVNELTNDLTDITHQVDRMAEIIDHMRVFSRFSNPELMELVDINTIIFGPFKVLGQQLKTHDIEVKTVLSPDLPKVLGNSIRLEQVFLNLLTNARHALDECQKKEKKIEIISYYIHEKSAVIIEIKDNANGIPKHLHEKIFQPFFTTKDPGKGTGLGLSISSKIIKEHKGKLELESEVGKGTTFKICLPVEASNLAVKPAPLE